MSLVSCGKVQHETKLERLFVAQREAVVVEPRRRHGGEEVKGSFQREVKWFCSLAAPRKNKYTEKAAQLQLRSEYWYLSSVLCVCVGLCVLVYICVCVCGCVKQMPFCWSQSTSIRLQPKSSRRAPPGRGVLLAAPSSPSAGQAASKLFHLVSQVEPAPDGEHLPRQKNSQAATERRHRQSVHVSAATRCHRQCCMLTHLLCCGAEAASQQVSMWSLKIGTTGWDSESGLRCGREGVNVLLYDKY